MSVLKQGLLMHALPAILPLTNTASPDDSLTCCSRASCTLGVVFDSTMQFKIRWHALHLAGWKMECLQPLAVLQWAWSLVPVQEAPAAEQIEVRCSLPGQGLGPLPLAANVAAIVMLQLQGGRCKQELWGRGRLFREIWRF